MTRWGDLPGRGTADAYQARFDRLAATGRSMHGEADLVSRLVDPPARVLDAGCGTGRVAVELARRGHPVVGVDVSPEMLTVARGLAPGIEWREADLASFAADAPFDLVVCAGNVLPLVAPGTEPVVLGNLAAALAPGGLLVTGFGLDAAHLPLPAAPFTLAEYDAWSASAGLTLRDRFATWSGDPYTEAAGYAVSIHAAA